MKPELNWKENTGEKPKPEYYLVYYSNGKINFYYSECLDWSLDQTNPILYYVEIDK